MKQKMTRFLNHENLENQLILLRKNHMISSNLPTKIREEPKIVACHMSHVACRKSSVCHLSELLVCCSDLTLNRNSYSNPLQQVTCDL